MKPNYQVSCVREVKNVFFTPPDLISILVAESMQYLVPRGAFNGIMVGTATDPAVILAATGEHCFKLSLSEFDFCSSSPDKLLQRVQTRVH